MNHLEMRMLGRWAFRLLVALFVLAITGGGALASMPTNGLAEQKPPVKNEAKSQPPIGPAFVGHEIKHDVSPPLASIPSAKPQTKIERELPRRIPGKTGAQDVDSVVQRTFGPFVMPTPIISADGVFFGTSSCNCAPPDTNGDVGPNHYVQTVNTAYQIFTKAGASVGAARPINTLWTGFGGVCETRNDGDPIVKYDQLADRWVINQFTTAPPFTQCIAVSTTGDPNGSYYRYAFAQFDSANRFGDYQKIGVWPDGYYMSNNEFNAAGTVFLGAGNYAFDRSRMLLGLSATYIYFGLPASDWGSQQPSDLDGANPPPPGAPNLFVEIDDQAWNPPNIPSDRIQMWRFHADFAVPANSTFTALPILSPAPFDAILCNFGSCVPQPGTAQRLDTLADRLMYRVAYRNHGGYESIVFNHTVDTGVDKAAIRWYELRGINSAPSIFQQGTYDPNTDHHWMGSIAEDNQGNIALGYSVSSSATFPSIRYTGRLLSDPLGQLPQGEGTLINGTGSQTNPGRWGDYSSISVDPVDDCTFWYTQEYYAVNSSFNWRTRFGSFKYAGCTAPVPNTPTATVTGTPPTTTRTSTATNTPTATPTPCGLSANYSIAVGTATIVPGVTDTGNHCDDCTTTISLPFAFTLYDTNYGNINVSSNGVASFISIAATYTNECLLSTSYPTYTIFPYWDDQLTDGVGAGIFTSVSGTAPNRIFNIEWRTSYFSGGGTANYELRLYEGQTKFDIIYGAVSQGNASATSGVQKDSSRFTQYFCNGNGGDGGNGRLVTYILPSCATSTPVATSTRTATATPTQVCLSADYQIAQTDGVSIVPGTSYVSGSTCNACVMTVNLPFAYTLYDQTFTSINASNKGNLQFLSSNSDGNNTCLANATFNYAMFPYWDDLNTNINDNMGIFTSVSGTAPNRIFNIEWRAGFVANDVRPAFEVRLYEGQPKFEYIYGATRGGFSATIGVQQGTGGAHFTQYSCNTNGTIIPGRKLVFDLRSCSAAK